MNCKDIEIDGIKMIVCGRGGPYCHRKDCRNLSEFQCDFPIGRYKSGKKKDTIRTCDRHLCADHAKHGITKGIDFCEEHYPIAKANHARRLEELVNRYHA